MNNVIFSKFFVFLCEKYPNSDVVLYIATPSQYIEDVHCIDLPFVFDR